MELKQAPLYKDHGYRSCISASFSLLTGNLKYIISKTWIYATAFSLLVSLLLVTMPSPMMMYTVLEQQPSRLINIVCLPMFIFVAQLFFHSSVTTLLTKRTLMWNIWRNFKAVISLVLLFSILTAVLTAAVFGALKAWRPEALTPVAVLATGVAMFFLLFILLMPLPYSMMKYIMEPSCKLRRMISKDYMTGLKHWGYIFAVVLTLAICLWLLCFVVSVPSVVLTWANNVSESGVFLNGDESGLPSNFVYMRFAVSLVTMFVSSYINIVMIFAAYYIYGSITQREEMLKAQKTKQ